MQSDPLRNTATPIRGLPRLSKQLLTVTLPTALLVFSSTSNAIFDPQEGPFPREGECNIEDPLFADVRHLLGKDQNIGPGTLKGLEVPEPPNLNEFVRDRTAAIALGKTLFWSMDIGSDGIQACGSCHFRAGADPRSKNQISPSGEGNPDLSFDLAPNQQLTAADFPLHLIADPNDRTSAVLRSTNDVVSSQGVFLKDFVAVQPGALTDIDTVVPDPAFQVNGLNTRRVEPRNTPTMINAVFNQRQFWDGRADPIFNGVNEFGVRDPNAVVFKANGLLALEPTKLRIVNASLASQAVGPPRSNNEMGSNNRPFADIARRVLPARALRQQEVHPQDSVLARMRASFGTGLNRTYAQMVQDAFRQEWWQSGSIIVVDANGNPTVRPHPNRTLRANEYTLMEFNFSLMFGLAVQLYETTLVSDDAEIDRHFDSIAAGGPGLLDEQELLGLELFEEAGCADCHSGPEFTSVGVRSEVTGFINPELPPEEQLQPPEQIERMVIGSCEIAAYDQGFYNLGVQPFEADLGIGGLDPFGNPLSIARLVTSDPTAIPSQELFEVHYAQIADVTDVPPIAVGERTSAMGAFKMPGLRNVELTAPYFHNGGKLTLREVVEFYNRGGDFHDAIGSNGVPQDTFMDLEIGRLELTEEEIDAIVAFLKTLTDPRVVAQSAPFDHPQLFVPNGHSGDENNVQPGDTPGTARTDFINVPAVGRQGGPLEKGFLEP